jgi:hypothetical protein
MAACRLRPGSARKGSRRRVPAPGRNDRPGRILSSSGDALYRGRHARRAQFLVSPVPSGQRKKRRLNARGESSLPVRVTIRCACGANSDRSRSKVGISDRDPRSSTRTGRRVRLLATCSFSRRPRSSTGSGSRRRPRHGRGIDRFCSRSTRCWRSWSPWVCRSG